MLTAMAILALEGVKLMGKKPFNIGNPRTWPDSFVIHADTGVSFVTTPVVGKARKYDRLRIDGGEAYCLFALPRTEAPKEKHNPIASSLAGVNLNGDALVCKRYLVQSTVKVND